MFHSEMSVPIYTDNRSDSFPKSIPISRGDARSYSSMSSRPSDNDFRQRMRRGSMGDPMNSRRLDQLEDVKPLRRNIDSDIWFEDMRKRFDERRRQWDEEVQRMRADFFTPPPRAEIQSVIPRETTPSMLEQRVTTKYEYGGDGKLNFMTTFDVREYDPNDVKVTLRNGEIIVTACTRNIRSSSYRTKEFSRSVNLPNDVDQGNISASIDVDNMLVLKCPIRSPIPNSTPVYKVTTGSTSLTTFEPRESNSSSKKGRISPIRTVVANKIVKTPTSTFNVDIPIGEEYAPGEIQVRTMNNRVFVSARHEEKLSNQNTFREFSKEYDISDHIDPKSITATLEKGILHLVGYPFARNT